jgi:hypothetical protein
MFQTEVDVPIVKPRSLTSMAIAETSIKMDGDLTLESMLDHNFNEKPTLLKQFETDSEFKGLLSKIVNRT